MFGYHLLMSCMFFMYVTLYSPVSEAVTAQKDSVEIVAICLELTAETMLARNILSFVNGDFLWSRLTPSIWSPYPIPPTACVRCILPHMKKVITCSFLSILINMFIFHFKWKKNQSIRTTPLHMHCSCRGPKFCSLKSCQTLTTTYNSSSKGSSALFWSSQASAHMVHTWYIQAYTHMKWLFFFFFFCNEWWL